MLIQVIYYQVKVNLVQYRTQVLFLMKEPGYEVEPRSGHEVSWR